MLAMLLHRLISTVYLNRAYIRYLADRAYIRYRTGIFFARTPQNTAKENTKKYKKTEQNHTTFSQKYQVPRTNQRINVPTITYLDP